MSESGYAIVEAEDDSAEGFAPRGAIRDLWNYRGREVIVSGGAECGKTWGALHKLDALLWKYPGAQAVVARKILATVYPTVLRTYRRILGDETPIRFYGGEKPEWADYPNGSRAWFAGMDKAGKALSSERDFIFVNQAEELTLGDWEVLTTRCTGRGAVAPYTQMLGDCNPGAPSHWILHRPSLEVLYARHEDNPTLFDDSGEITEQGRRTLATLDDLTGVRKQRLRFGKWVQAEGAVYDDWDRAVHLVDRFVIPPSWRRVRSVDFGFTNPFVCLWVAVDPDGRMYLYREVYRTQTLVADHADRIADLSTGQAIEATVTDHDAEDRATLEAPRPATPSRPGRPGIPTTAAYKAITPGIQAVQERLRVAGDGRPRLFVFRDALAHPPDPALAGRHMPTCTAEEFESYSWAEGRDGRPSKEVPIDRDNHGLDALRYAVAHVDRLGRPAPAGPIVVGGPARPGLHGARP